MADKLYNTTEQLKAEKIWQLFAADILLTDILTVVLLGLRLEAFHTKI
jgi:hypothetical protein